MKRIALALVLAALASGARAQSSPNLIFGQVPTPAQWNSYFAAKMDYSGQPACLTTGCTFTGAITVQGAITGTSYVQSGTTVVGSLPACNASLEGARYYITDASAITYRTTVTGGGSTRGAVLCSNSAWIGD